MRRPVPAFTVQLRGIASPTTVKVQVSTEPMPHPSGLGAEDFEDGIENRHVRLLLEAARHIEALERGLMNLARLPVQAHAARLGLLHELLGRCGQGLAGQLKVASALRASAVDSIDGDEITTAWELLD